MKDARQDVWMVGVIYIPAFVTPPALAADWCPRHSRYFQGNRGGNNACFA